MRRRRLIAMAAFLSASLLGLGLQTGEVEAGQKKNKGPGPAGGAVDPHGKPKAFDAGKKEAYAVWFDNNKWHLSVTTHKKDRDVFTGTVRANRGRILGDFKKLEKGRPDAADWIFPHRDGTGFDFRFVNVGKLDTVVFQASPDATELAFSLLIDGGAHPDRVLVGRRNVRPPAVPFTLPAHP